MTDDKQVCCYDLGKGRGRERYKVAREFHKSIDDPLRPANLVKVHRKSDGKVLIELTTRGELTVYDEYSWDGPSGLTKDTPDFMRGSLVHDVLYQLLREGRLFDLTDDVKHDRKRHKRLRKAADKLLRKILKKDGMKWPRRWLVYRTVRWFGRSAAKRRGGFEKPSTGDMICAP